MEALADPAPRVRDQALDVFESLGEDGAVVLEAPTHPVDEGRQVDVEDGVNVFPGGLHDAVVGEFTQRQVDDVRPQCLEMGSGEVLRGWLGECRIGLPWN